MGAKNGEKWSFCDRRSFNGFLRRQRNWSAGGKVDSVLYLGSKGEATHAQLAVIFMRYVQNIAEAK